MPIGNQPPARGRLGFVLNQRQEPKPAEVTARHACHVNASLAEDGTFIVQVAGAATYNEGIRVGATIEQIDIPVELQDALQKALQAILDESHEYLKEELDREVEHANVHVPRPEVAAYVESVRQRERSEREEL